MHPLPATSQPTQAGAQLLPLGTLAAGTVFALSLLFFQQPLAAAAVMLCIPVVLWVVARPDVATWVVLFLLYSNAAVVAVKFHGLPHSLGMLLPAPLLLPLGVYVLFRKQPILFTRTLPWIALFLLLQTVSVALARDPREAMLGLKIAITEGLFVYLVLTNVVRTRRVLIGALWVLLIAGAAMGGLSLFQQVTGTHHNDYGGFAQTGEGKGFGIATNRGTTHQARLCGPIGEQNRYAQIMLMLIPIGLFSCAAEKSWRRRALLLGMTVLIAAGCALTFSRGAAVAFAFLVLLMTAMRYIKPVHLVGIGLATALLLAAVPQYRTRLASIPQSVGIFSKHGNEATAPDGAVKGRATAMLAAFRVFVDHPIVGVGPGMFNSYFREYGRVGGFRVIEGSREAHCLYLEIAAEQGALGLLAFGAVIFVSLRNLTRLRRSLLVGDPRGAAITTGLLLAVVGYLATGMFLHFSYARYFWLMLALADSTGHIFAQATPPARDEVPNLGTASG